MYDLTNRQETRDKKQDYNLRDWLLFTAYCLSFFFCQLPSAHCQPDSTDYFNENFMRYDDYIYRSNIKTVKFENPTIEFSEPLLELNSGEQLLLKFDDLDADVKDYWYTIIHCDANWKPSEIIQSTFLSSHRLHQRCRSVLIQLHKVNPCQSSQTAKCLKFRDCSRPRECKGFCSHNSLPHCLWWDSYGLSRSCTILSM